MKSTQSDSKTRRSGRSGTFRFIPGRSGTFRIFAKTGGHTQMSYAYFPGFALQKHEIILIQKPESGLSGIMQIPAAKISGKNTQKCHLFSRQ